MMQKPKSKIQSRRTGGVRTRLFGERKLPTLQAEVITLRKPLLQFKIFNLEIVINRTHQISLEKVKARHGFGRI